LVIDDAHLDDAADITVVLPSDNKSTAKLTVTEEPVKIVEHIKNLTVMETSTAQFTCELNKMNYNIEWFIGEVLIKDRPRFRMEHHEYSYTLYISDCKVEDGSEFTCVAGDVSSTATLTVQEAPVEFIVPLKDVDAMEHETAR
ncbi:unnamed protein product, partial [Owenia fusiformis]